MKMKHNKKISPENKFYRDASVIQICIAGIFLVFIFGINVFSQTDKKENSMKNSTQTEISENGYLDKTDPVFVSIKSRAANDLKTAAERANPESAENKLLMEKIKTWNEKKRNQLQELSQKSIYDYNMQTHFDVETFMLVFDEFGKMDLKQIQDEYDIRIKNLGNDKFAAEFWEDGLAVNSEKHAQERANEITARFPEDAGRAEIIKENFAGICKAIKSGKQERYTKVMALLYTKEKDGSVTFHDPGQPVFDFISK